MRFTNLSIICNLINYVLNKFEILDYYIIIYYYYITILKFLAIIVHKLFNFIHTREHQIER